MKSCFECGKDVEMEEARFIDRDMSKFNRKDLNDRIEIHCYNCFKQLT